ncbi:hypothetical protein D3C73_1549470 [compost metagenome]
MIKSLEGKSVPSFSTNGSDKVLASVIVPRTPDRHRISACFNRLLLGPCFSSSSGSFISSTQMSRSRSTATVSRSV